MMKKLIKKLSRKELKQVRERSRDCPEVSSIAGEQFLFTLHGRGAKNCPLHVSSAGKLAAGDMTHLLGTDESSPLHTAQHLLGCF